jgi:Protein of unknown function (DUF3107)
VNIRIGIQQSMKEIELEMPASLSDADLRAQVTAALKDDDVLWLTDKKGRTVGVPAARISYVEMAATSERVVGFGS